MSKKLRELLQALETEKAKVCSLLAENKVLDGKRLWKKCAPTKACGPSAGTGGIEDQTLDDATPSTITTIAPILN